ncbi:MAG: hypothetical protein CO029_02355 [Candidatus Magasanikbacteria bacterium CG_4_9_14_0_2_um_filter_41_10]|nr:MAG: hypothetical protein CO029_02355 [Candidatus Magasanikbacteria bacterium CG_4_9_14_0_2_um_filter_41_10]
MKKILGASAMLCALLLVGAGCAPATDDYSATDGDTNDGSDVLDNGGGTVVKDDSALTGSFADCPSATELATFTSTDASVVEGGPFDTTSFTFAKAKWEGNKLNVFISNKEYAASKFGGLDSPVKGADKGTGVLQLVFSNGAEKADVAPYNPAAGYGQSHWVTAEMLVPVGPTGTDALLSMSSGSAEVAALDGSKVCGTFSMTGNNSAATGAFVATF